MSQTYRTGSPKFRGVYAIQGETSTLRVINQKLKAQAQAQGFPMKTFLAPAPLTAKDRLFVYTGSKDTRGVTTKMLMERTCVYASGTAPPFHAQIAKLPGAVQLPLRVAYGLTSFLTLLVTHTWLPLLIVQLFNDFYKKPEWLETQPEAFLHHLEKGHVDPEFGLVRPRPPHQAAGSP
jgi:hypothetical protein